MEVGPSMTSRISALLRTLAASEPTGAATTDVANRTGLPRPTAHRLLTAMLDEGMTERDEIDASWHLGPECYLLGAAATTRHDATPAARETVQRIARETGESAFFSVRRGDETFCLLREDGSFPIRSHVLHEGIRFPLGVASAGLAVLAFLPEREREGFLQSINLVPGWGTRHSADLLRERIVACRRDGYAVNPGLIVEGSWGVGAVVFDTQEQPRWALSITGIEARISPRQRELGQLLLREAHALASRLASGRGAR